MLDHQNLLFLFLWKYNMINFYVNGMYNVKQQGALN